MNDSWSQRLDRAIVGVTQLAHRRPWTLLAVAFGILAVSWSLASTLRVKGDFVELLPTESTTAERFRKTLERRGGSGSTLMVMVASPDREQNRKLVDAIEARVRKLPPELLDSVEHGPGKSRDFFLAHKWLFASKRDLSLVECEVRYERESKSPGFLDLEEPCEEQFPPEPSETPVGAAAPAETDEKAPDGDASALARLRARLDGAERENDRFPSGYFEGEEGKLFALVLRSSAAGMGEQSTDELLRRVERIVAEVDPASFHPQAEVGLTGSIPTAIAERDALIEDMTIVTTVAVTLILGSIVIFFRSAWPLVHIGLAVGTGCGVAFAAAAIAYGTLNAATSFLGSIILGNGINDSIIYIARYRERRAAGDGVLEALVETSRSVRKGTWLASVAAGGAYGALTVTSFRGFSEFGLIGLVGMVTCWIATFAFVPAAMTVTERVHARLGRSAKRTTDAVAPPPAVRPVISRAVAALARRYPVPILLGGVVLAGLAAWPLPAYLRDPWEYDFSKLRSKSSATTGASYWSPRADKIFVSRGSPVLMLADDASQALALAAAVKERDRALTDGRYVERVETIHDRLGGAPELVKEKLEILGRIREEIDRALPRLEGEDAEFVKRWRPPEALRAPTPEDLPDLVRAQFAEKDGRVGTPVYVYLARGISQSRGENLLQIADILETTELPGGGVAPNASRATVFAEMIRSMERDGPRATLAAFAVVIAVALLVTRAVRAIAAVVGSLVLGVLLTVGGAAWLDVRLNFLNFVALPLTFGIGVEYAINLYDRIRFTGGDVAAAVASAGGPVALCSLTTILGYGSLVFADNQALGSFGRYAVAGEISTLVTAILVMPALLHLSARRSREKA